MAAAADGPNVFLHVAGNRGFAKARRTEESPARRL